MTTKYRTQIDFDGCEVLRDKYGDPPPGDPHGPWQYRSTQLAYGHKVQELWGWQYASTVTSEAPAGAGWELNTYVGDGGRDSERTYWRRRKP